MAMTATLAANPTSVKAAPGTSNQTTLTLTVSNSSTTAINVLSIRPYVYDSGTTQSLESVSLGLPVLNTNNASVPGSSNTTFSWTVAFNGPEAAGTAGSYYLSTNNASTLAYDCGCEVMCADGTLIYPTVVTITVSQPPRS